MVRKRLIANLWHYGRIMVYSAVACWFSWFIIDAGGTGEYAGWGESFSQLWVKICVYASLAGSCAAFFYAILSCLVNKAVFDVDFLQYRTIFKHYHILYGDILKIDSYHETIRTRRSPFRRKKSVYTVMTAKIHYKLSSHEFLGLRKQMDQLRLDMNGGNQDDH
jgi:hypothetical protein